MHDPAQERVNESLNSYVGRSISEVTLKLGPPTTQIPAPGGRTIFQWHRVGATQSPGMAVPVGNMVVYNAPQTNLTECRLSMVARADKPNPGFADWVVETWQYHGTGCV